MRRGYHFLLFQHKRCKVNKTGALTHKKNAFNEIDRIVFRITDSSSDVSDDFEFTEHSESINPSIESLRSSRNVKKSHSFTSNIRQKQHIGIQSIENINLEKAIRTIQKKIEKLHNSKKSNDISSDNQSKHMKYDEEDGFPNGHGQWDEQSETLSTIPDVNHVIKMDNVSENNSDDDDDDEGYQIYVMRNKNKLIGRKHNACPVSVSCVEYNENEFSTFLKFILSKNKQQNS